MIDLTNNLEWMEDLQELGKQYNVMVVAKGNDISAKRIAVLVTNSFLRNSTFDEVHKAGFIQRDVYEQSKIMNLYCEEIGEEERIKSLGHKGRGFDPLKLHPDTGVRNPELMSWIFSNLIPKGKEKNGKSTRNSTRNISDGVNRRDRSRNRTGDYQPSIRKPRTIS